MSQPVDSRRVADIMASWLSLEVITCHDLQSLWAGYGHICAVTAEASSDQVATDLHRLCGHEGKNLGKTFYLVLKVISPPHQNDDEGHLRKMFSYEVEQYFYDEVTPHLGQDVAVAKCLTSTRNMEGKANAKELEGIIATLMTDLRPSFPIAGGKRSVLEPRQVYAAVDWLANFHATSWKLLPDDLEPYLLPPLKEAKRRESTSNGQGHKVWLNGGYTYLDTRRSEYRSLAGDANSDWSRILCAPVSGKSVSIVELVAKFLTPSGRTYETYIHGDVKSENLFVTSSGDQVAFFDFQYVGLGLGVCDLAKLFTCSVPLHMLTNRRSVPKELSMCREEEVLLEEYRRTLLEARPPGKEDHGYDWDIFKRHWETALVDWCRFQASWGFWGNTEWLEARVRAILKDRGWRDWLLCEVSFFA